MESGTTIASERGGVEGDDDIDVVSYIDDSQLNYMQRMVNNFDLFKSVRAF